MRSYIEYHMPEAFNRHELKCLVDEENCKVFVMQRPDESAFRVQITFTPEGIAIQGDVGLGDAQNGICSRMGYGIGWFSKTLSEDYLCSKFLHQCWQRDAASRDLRSWLEQAQGELEEAWKEVEDDECLREELDEYQYVLHWQELLDFFGDEISEKELYEEGSSRFDDFWDYSVGYDYPLADAGWLCAIQKKFSELYGKESE